MKTGTLAAYLVAWMVAAPAQAVVLSCVVQEYSEEAGRYGDKVSAHESKRGTKFRIDTSAGWRTSETQYLLSAKEPGAGGEPLYLESVVDRATGEYVRTGYYRDASYRLVARCTKVEFKATL